MMKIRLNGTDNHLGSQGRWLQERRNTETKTHRTGPDRVVHDACLAVRFSRVAASGGCPQRPRAVFTDVKRTIKRLPIAVQMVMQTTANSFKVSKPATIDRLAF